MFKSAFLTCCDHLRDIQVSGREVFMFKPELVEADADDDEATEDISIYRRVDDVS